MADARLVIQKLNKSYAAPVLRDVSLTVTSGEIHAIVGENGAGKSTLVNILTGLTRRDSGELSLDDRAYEPANASAAFAAGVSFAAQELTGIDTLSVAENIGLRSLPGTRGVIDRHALQRRADQAMQQVGIHGITPDTPVGELGIADRQLIELAKALADGSRLLILDEPTAALDAPQADRLHRLIRERAESGASVIYISHRLEDVLDVADTISVLRDGVLVKSAPASSLDVDTLVQAMAGDAFRMAATPANQDVPGPLLIQADRITTADLPHALSVKGHAGEIIGIAGLAGAGRSELLQALFGLAPLAGGRVTRVANGAASPVQNASEAVGSGIAFLGEDRQAMGLFKGQSVMTNMMIPGAAVNRSNFALIDKRRERSATALLEQQLDLRCRDLDQDIAELSGGNQQKALIGRWLHCDSVVFLLDEPTRGVDINTKSAIYDMLASLRRDGKCILIASSEIEELMTVCDRILVLSSRKLVREFERGNWSQTEILSAAFEGHTDKTGTLG